MFTNTPAPTQSFKVGMPTKAPKANWAVLIDFVRLQENAALDKSGRTAEIHGSVRVDNPLAQLANRLRTLVAVSTMAIMWEKTIFFGFSGIASLLLHLIFVLTTGRGFFYCISDYRSLLLQL
jgi:hypothetical protein